MRKYLTLLLFLVLSGCFGATKNSEFYLLETQNAQEVISEAKLNIAVQDIILPDYLKKPQIVLQAKDSPQLTISEFHRWGSDFEQMVENTLTDDLQNVMPHAFIKPLIYGQNAQYIVQVNIDKLSGSFNEDAVLTGNYKIMTGRGKTIKEDNFRIIEPVGKDYVSYVEAQSRLIGQLAAMIAHGLQNIR